jgi:hypothetical protein
MARSRSDMQETANIYDYFLDAKGVVKRICPRANMKDPLVLSLASTAATSPHRQIVNNMRSVDEVFDVLLSTAVWLAVVGCLSVLAGSKTLGSDLRIQLSHHNTHHGTMPCE